MRGALATAIGVVVAATFTAHQGHAFQIHDPIHKDCHERITHAALHDTGYVRPPAPLAGDDARLPAVVEFPAGGYDQNLYALSLILGVRYPDTHGVPDFSFRQLAAGANAPDDQSAHCLRNADDDGVAGDAHAIAACRATITALYWQALATLDESGSVSPDVRTSGTFNTAFQGQVDYPLSEFYFFSGRALHAIQDSFTHTFRTADRTKIVHVMNWVDQIRCKLDEARDGHGHEQVFDDCEDGGPSMNARVSAARQASTEMLQALTSAGTRREREDRLTAFLDRWLTYQPGCAFADGYCHDPDYDWLTHSDRSNIDMCKGAFGCSGAGSGSERAGGGAGFGLGEVFMVMVAMTAFGVVRRRRAARAAAGVSVLAFGLFAPAAHADEAGHGFHAEARASLSVDNPAYAFGGAALYGFSRFEAGAFAELNPWYGIERQRMSLGATNFGLLGHYLHPLRPDLRLRFGVGLGLSMLNADMLGADAGKVGLYANVRLMGLVWQLAPNVALTADPLDIALPAPQLTGWPILYTQHRASIGAQFWF